MQALTTLAHRELARFFKVAAKLRSQGVASHMPACYVDTAWHELLLDTEKYRHFCHEAVGIHVSHLPTKGEGVLEWVPTYEEEFGELPSIWFTNTSGELDAGAYETYIASRQLKASWDCDPGDEAGRQAEHPKVPVKASWDCDPGDEAKTEYDRPQPAVLV